MSAPHDHDGALATLLRDHVSSDEPPFRMSAETPIALGRRTLARRRARRGLAGVLVAAAAVAAVPLLPWGGGGSGHGPAARRNDVSVATSRALQDYDALRMPTLIDERTRAALGDGVAGLGKAEFTAFDDQGQSLPRRHYDKASGMSVQYGDGDRRVEVELLHARSEAEGDARALCRRDVAEGIDFSCTVSSATTGDPVTTTIRAVRPLPGLSGWGLITPTELRNGVAGDTSPNGAGPIDPADVYFVRTVESVHSATFLTSARETVRAPSLAGAEKLWRVPVADLEKVATDPTLVIPEPPMGPGGCPWTWKAKVTCSRR